MPDGRTIRTIGEAAEYAISLPKKVRNTERWQRARVLHQAAGAWRPEAGGSDPRLIQRKSVF
jgi:hypothetical protein